MQTIVESPGSHLDYTFDWSGWLPTGDTLQSAAWTAPGLHISNTSITSTTATVFLDGLQNGESYEVTCMITTVGGRQDSRSILVNALQR